MTFQDTQISKFSQYQKSAKARFIIYANVECTIENIDGCKINPINSSTKTRKRTYSLQFLNANNIFI